MNGTVNIDISEVNNNMTDAINFSGINDDVLDVAMALDAGYGGARRGSCFAPGTPATPCMTRSPSSSIPFYGDYKGYLWNSQGLFHCSTSKQCKKWRQVLRYMQHSNTATSVSSVKPTALLGEPEQLRNASGKLASEFFGHMALRGGQVW